MKRLTNEDLNEALIDYMDGTLSAERQAEVEQYLASSPENAELLASMKAAQQVLVEWDAAEPVRTGEDFWPKLRDKLPAQPGRNPFRAFLSNLQTWLVPKSQGMRMAMTGAAIAAILAITAAVFAPQARHQTLAGGDRPVPATQTLSAEERAFIRNSQARHSAYESSQPWAGAVPPATHEAVGDVNSADRLDDDDANDSPVP